MSAAGQSASGSTTVTFVADTATKFKLTLSGGDEPHHPTVTAGVPIRLRVTAQDANNNTATTFTGNLSITSNAFAGTVNATISSGGLVNNVTITPTLAGSVVLTVTGGTITTGNAANAFTVTPAAASKLVFTSSAYTGSVAGVSSGVITVQRRDAFDNPNSADAALTVNLTSNGSGTYAFRNSADTATLTSMTIAQGSHSASFRYRERKGRLAHAHGGGHRLDRHHTATNRGPGGAGPFRGWRNRHANGGDTLHRYSYRARCLQQHRHRVYRHGQPQHHGRQHHAADHGALQQRYTHRKRHADHSGQWTHTHGHLWQCHRHKQRVHRQSRPGDGADPDPPAHNNCGERHEYECHHGHAARCQQQSHTQCDGLLYHHSGDLCQHRHNQPHRHYEQQRRGDRDAEIKHGCAQPRLR